jgi:hypothetical protein
MELEVVVKSGAATPLDLSYPPRKKQNPRRQAE